MTGLLIRLFVRNADKSTAAGRACYGRLCGFTGIVCNLVLFAIKLTAGLLSGSISIIADAFNNFSDMGSSLITMFGFKMAAKPADKEHPYGHGRMEYMSGCIVSAIIVVVGGELLKSSFEKAVSPEKITVDAITVSILVVSILIKLWLFFFNRKVGRLLDSGAVAATARDSLNDVIATSAVLAAALVYRFSGVNVDAYAGLAVSAFIIYGGISSAAATVKPLLGEPPTREFVDKIKASIMSYGKFCGVHDVIVHDYGPGRCFVSAHIEVPADIDILSAHEEIDLCEKEVGEALGITLVAHMDPVESGDDVKQLRDTVAAAVGRVDGSLSIHDFRVVRGENRSNLIFDVVVPFDCKKERDEIRNSIRFEVSKTHPECVCVINFDNEFVG